MLKAESLPSEPSGKGAKATMDRISMGIPGLDAMLEGGLIPRRPYLVTGPSGSGKTILGVQFLIEGIKNGESVFHITLDEPPNEIKENMAQFGWPIGSLRILDATPDIKTHKKKNVIDVGTSLDVRKMGDVGDIRKSHHVRSLEVSIHSVQKVLKQEFRDHLRETGKRYTRVVVDSMTSLRMFTMGGEDVPILIESFLRFLSELEVTALLVASPSTPNAIDTEFLLARGEVRLHKWIESNAVRRGISIERFRGSHYDESIRPMTIGSTGLTVAPDAELRLRGPMQRGVDQSYLEGRVIDEILVIIEQVLAQMEQAEKMNVPTTGTSVAVTRAMFHFNRKRYGESMRIALQAKSALEEKLAAHWKAGK